MKNVLEFNVQQFGAIGDGETLATSAIAEALQSCAEAGGGRVVFPAGIYLTGPIELRSGVELHLDEGARVLFSRNFDLYPLCLANFEGQQTVVCRSPLWGKGLSDVAITGKGTFDGQGEAWRPVKKMKLEFDAWQELVAGGGVVDEERGIWWPTRNAMEGEQVVRALRASGKTPRIEDYAPARDYLRPNMVQLLECSNVVIDGPTFTNSPCWNVHLLMCENVAVRNVTILNPWYAQNGDGLDIESCRNVEISDCFLDVGDDAICLKSGKDAEGRKRARPCEDIAVRGCTVLHGHGGLVVGSEMSGGVRNVHVSNCEFRGTDVGLRFKTARGRGGIVENIEIHDITMSEITGAAISFDMYYGGTSWSEDGKATMQAEPVTEATPQFRSVAIRNVTCEGARRAIELRGLPEMPIESITLENVCIRAKRGVLLQEVKDVVLSNVEIAVDVMPAMDCSDVANLTLEHFRGALFQSSAPSEFADLTPVLRTAKTLSGATHNGHQRVG